MKFEPAERIVVVSPTTLKDAGIKDSFIEPVVTKDQPELGKIIAVGKAGEKGFPVKGLKKDAVIAYRRYGEAKFFLGAEEILFVGFDDVLGVVHD